MGNVLLMKKSELKEQFRDGLSRQLMLENAHEEVRLYKCTLKAGCGYEPELYGLEDRVQMFFFINPSGYVATKTRAWNITEQAAFIPNFKKERFWIEAGEEDLEFIHLVGNMNDWDVENYIDYHIITPRFKKVSEGMSYREYHSGNAGSRIESRLLVEDTACGRWCMGIQNGTAPDFIGSHCHEELDQWSYVLPGSDFTYTVDGKAFKAEAGDLVYIPRGVCHSIEAEDGKGIRYVWIKLATDGFSTGRDGYPGSEH